MATSAILSKTGRKNLFAVAIISGFILAVGFVFEPARVWSNLLVGAFFVLTTALGGGVFVALASVSGAGWHVAFRRVPETLAKMVPFAGAAVLIVLTLRMREYGWQHSGHGGAGTFWFKEVWLTPGFWMARSVGYVIVWSLLGAALVRQSRAGSDATPSTAGRVRLSALFLVVYAVTFSLASIDWLMALEPMWFSTMWGVYSFSGMIMASLAAVAIFCIRLSEPGRPLHGVFNTEHLHDLGRLLIGFSCFWMYIWFSQYMLIWYSNIPEETSYFIARTNGPWGPVVLASICLNWVVPFFVLLPRSSKRSSGVMFKIAIVILVGRWVDLCVMVFPPIIGLTPVIGLWEVAAACCAISAGLLLFERCFREDNPVPLGDPYLAESLHYHA